MPLCPWPAGQAGFCGGQGGEVIDLLIFRLLSGYLTGCKRSLVHPRASGWFFDQSQNLLEPLGEDPSHPSWIYHQLVLCQSVCSESPSAPPVPRDGAVTCRKCKPPSFCGGSASRGGDGSVFNRRAAGAWLEQFSHGGRVGRFSGPGFCWGENCTADPSFFQEAS